MVTEKRDEKMGEIKVLDKGKSFDGPIIAAVFCCGVIFIPFRY